MNFRFNKIPRLFHSDYTEEPFEKCIHCGCELLHSGTPYTIQKQYVAGEAVFEMSLCGTCQMEFRSQMSEESLASMESFVAENCEAPEDPELIEPGSPEDNIEKCAFCEKTRSECHRFAVTGFLINERMLVGLPQGSPVSLPIMVCDDCNMAMNENLSKKTRDSWNRFVEDHFDGPPGIELPEDQPAPWMVG